MVLKVGRIVIPKFILRDVTIIKSGYTIVSRSIEVWRLRSFYLVWPFVLQHIEEISLHSSLINSEVTKFLSVVIHDVRVNKDVIEKQQNKPGSILKPLLSKQNSLVNTVPVGSETKKILNDVNDELNRALDFRDMKLPSSLILFTEVISI